MLYRDNKQAAKKAFDDAGRGLRALDNFGGTLGELEQDGLRQQRLIEEQRQLLEGMLKNIRQPSPAMTMLGWAIILAITAVVSYAMGAWIGWM